MHVTTPTHVAHGWKTLRTYAFPYGKILSAIILIVNQQSLPSNAYNSSRLRAHIKILAPNVPNSSTNSFFFKRTKQKKTLSRYEPNTVYKLIASIATCTSTIYHASRLSTYYIVGYFHMVLIFTYFTCTFCMRK